MSLFNNSPESKKPFGYNYFADININKPLFGYTDSNKQVEESVKPTGFGGFGPMNATTTTLVLDGNSLSKSLSSRFKHTTTADEKTTKSTTGVNCESPENASVTDVDDAEFKNDLYLFVTSLTKYSDNEKNDKIYEEFARHYTFFGPKSSKIASLFTRDEIITLTRLQNYFSIKQNFFLTMFNLKLFLIENNGMFDKFFFSVIKSSLKLDTSLESLLVSFTANENLFRKSTDLVFFSRNPYSSTEDFPELSCDKKIDIETLGSTNYISVKYNSFPEVKIYYSMEKINPEQFLKNELIYYDISEKKFISMLNF